MWFTKCPVINLSDQQVSSLFKLHTEVTLVVTWCYTNKLNWIKIKFPVHLLIKISFFLFWENDPLIMNLWKLQFHHSIPLIKSRFVSDKVEHCWFPVNSPDSLKQIFPPRWHLSCDTGILSISLSLSLCTHLIWLNQNVWEQWNKHLTVFVIHHSWFTLRILTLESEGDPQTIGK